MEINIKKDAEEFRKKKTKEQPNHPVVKAWQKKEYYERNRIISQYIFDKDLILKHKTFTQCEINKNNFGFGIFLPKEIELKDKQGRIIGKEQKWNPVLISSHHSLLEVTKELEIRYKIKINPIPSVMELQWSLASIKNYLNEKTKEEIKINGADLFKKIKSAYEQFLYFRNQTWYEIHTLWDIGTYFFMLFNTFPLLELRGMSGTAKSKVMKVSRVFSLNPTKLMINPSEATLFRETHDKRPTKYIDEAEKLFQFNRGQMEADQRVELINGSYSKGSVVPRIEKINGRFITVYYECYSPTMIGSIRGLYGATESRAITHIMTKSPDKDPRGDIEVEDYKDEEYWQDIRDSLYIFALQNWKKIKKIYWEIEIKANIKKRDLQLWKPLLTIAKLINENLFQEIQKFAEKVSMQRKEDLIPESTLDYKILETVKALLDLKEKLYVERIKNKYVEITKEEVKRGFNRTITIRLDNLGFKDFRHKDRIGSYFEINPELFSTIISPICPHLVNFASQSSQSSPNINNIDNTDDNNINNINNNVTHGDTSDAKTIETIKICDASDVNEGNDARLDKRRKEEDVEKGCLKSQKKVSKKGGLKC